MVMPTLLPLDVSREQRKCIHRAPHRDEMTLRIRAVVPFSTGYRDVELRCILITAINLPFEIQQRYQRVLINHKLHRQARSFEPPRSSFRRKSSDKKKHHTLGVSMPCPTCQPFRSPSMPDRADVLFLNTYLNIKNLHTLCINTVSCPL